MKISTFCIERPVFAFVINAIIVLFGVLSYQYLNIEFNPKTFEPELSIKTTYTGASTKVIKNEISDKIVNSISSVAGIQAIESISKKGESRIKIYFSNISKQDFQSAESDIMRAISSVKLPENATSPILRQGASSNQIMVIGFSDKERTTNEIASYINQSILNQVQKINGVASANLFNNSQALRINILPKNLSLYKLSITDIINQIQILNSEISAGQIITKDNSYSININTDLNNIEKFQNIIVSNINGREIYLKDIADISLGDLTLSGSLFGFINNIPGVLLAVNTTSDANPITVAKSVKDYIANLNKNLPIGIKANILFDITEPLEETLYEVLKTILEAIIFVALISLLFLGRIKTTLIPIVTIPICLIGVLGVISLLDFSINMMTLLALVLAVGLVVDDAIVILENCYFYVEKGYSSKLAAIKGTGEVGFAVIAMTITLIAIYLPLIFLQGKTAVYFQQFAFTLAGAILISGFVALTLSPSMCALILNFKKNDKSLSSKYQNYISKFFIKVERLYKVFLVKSLKTKKYFLSIFLLLIILGIIIFKSLPSKFEPNDTIGIFGSFLKTDNTTDTKVLAKKIQNLNTNIENKVPVKDSFSYVFSSDSGTLRAISFYMLNKDDIKNINNYVQVLNSYIFKLQGVRGYAFPIPLSMKKGGYGNGDIEFFVQGIISEKEIYQEAINLQNILEKLPQIQTVDIDFDIDDKQFNINIDNNLAYKLGVSIDEIKDNLSIILGGYYFNNNYQFKGESYPIILQAPKKDLGNFNILKYSFVKSNDGVFYNLNRFVKIIPVLETSSLITYNQLNALSMSVSLKEGSSIGNVMNDIQNLVDENFNNISISFSGDALELKNSNNNMLLIAIAGLILIYLILAALFESFLDPLIILLTIPVCIVGGLLGLKLFNGSLNIYTEIALITLIGLIAKHGVLIVQFANDLRKKGFSVTNAIIIGSVRRLRPILMTSLTMILGAVPLVLSDSVGYLAREQIGLVIIFGLIIGSIFSLIIVPICYLFFKSLIINYNYK